jgi:hypothetical protein
VASILKPEGVEEVDEDGGLGGGLVGLDPDGVARLQ